MSYLGHNTYFLIVDTLLTSQRKRSKLLIRFFPLSNSVENKYHKSKVHIIVYCPHPIIFVSCTLKSFYSYQMLLSKTNTKLKVENGETREKTPQGIRGA